MTSHPSTPTSSSTPSWARADLAVKALYKAAAGPGLGRHQPTQPLAVHPRGGLIVRRPGELERSRRGRDRRAVDPHPPHHLVFDLHEIAGIEELRGRELLVTHRLRAGIQRPRLGQRRLLSIRLPLPRHDHLQLDVRPIMPSYADDPMFDTPRSLRNHSYVSR